MSEPNQGPALRPAEKLIERPSPLTGVAQSSIALIAVAFIVGRQLLEGPAELSGTRTVLYVVLAVITVLSGIGGIFAWRTTTFVADDDEFRVERNFISRASTRVDYTKVQSIDISQPFVARLMGLAKVHIDVGGESGVDLTFLTKARAEALREHLLNRMSKAKGELSAPGSEATPAPDQPSPTLSEAPDSPELVVRVATPVLLAGTLVSLGTLGALIGSGALLWISIASGSPVTMIAAVLGVTGWVWGKTAKNWGFTMTSSGGALRISRGALSKSNQGLRPGRIQAIAVSQDLLQRCTGLYRMRVTVLGYRLTDDDDSGNTVLLPAGTAQDVSNVLAAIWPEVDLNAVTAHRQPRRARWLTPLTWSTHTWGIGEHIVVAEHGRLTRVRSLVPHRRMQSASLVQGPLQRLLSLASIDVHTTTGPVNLRLYHLDAAEARNVLETQVARARHARAADISAFIPETHLDRPSTGQGEDEPLR